MQSTAGYYGHVAVVEQVYKNGIIKFQNTTLSPIKIQYTCTKQKAARNFNYIY